MSVAANRLRVLHLLSQRPSRTGSGITLEAFVAAAAQRGYDQRVVVGVPADDTPAVGPLADEHLIPLRFGTAELPFPVPGMSDVMPYPSTVFATLDDADWARYREAWRTHLAAVVEAFRPDLIHAHHVWLLGSIVKDVAPDTPVVTHCHATGLRQLELCPERRGEEVVRGIRRNDAFVVLHRGHADTLRERVGVPAERIDVVGAGYRDDLFHAHGRRPWTSDATPHLVYVGKLSPAKGLDELLDAFTALTDEHPELELDIVGSGAGPEAERIGRRIAALEPHVHALGPRPQPELATLMRERSICVLPSYYEGLPLVLVEAVASGCRVVATALPGVVEQLAPVLGSALHLVDPPRRMAAVDVPADDERGPFRDRLRDAIDAAVRAGPIHSDIDLSPMTWHHVFDRVERVWQRVLEHGSA